MIYLRIAQRILALVIALAAANRAYAEPQQLKVGIIVPLSGEASSLGQACSNGAELAFEELAPDVRDRLSLIYEDDALTAKHAISALNKLSAVADIDAVLCLSSGIGRVLAPLTEQRRIPLIAVGASDHGVSKDRKYVVTFWVSPEEEARIIVPEIIRRGYRNIAQIVSQNDGMIVLRDVVNRESRDAFKVSVQGEFPVSEKDFRPAINRIKHTPTDAIMVFLLPGQLGVFAHQARQLELKQPIFGFESLEDAGEVAASHGALIGAWYVNAADPEPAFITRYRTRFPTASFWGAAHCHDAVLMVGAAAAQGAGREQLNTFLHEVRGFRGAAGVYSATGDNRFTLPAALKIVTKDGFAPLAPDDVPR